MKRVLMLMVLLSFGVHAAQKEGKVQRVEIAANTLYLMVEGDADFFHYDLNQANSRHQEFLALILSARTTSERLLVYYENDWNGSSHRIVSIQLPLQ